MYDFQTLNWIPLKKEKDEYLLILTNYMNANLPDIDSFYFKQFRGHCQTQTSANNSVYTIFELIIRNKIGEEITTIQKDFVENIFKEADSKYRNDYEKTINKK